VAIGHYTAATIADITDATFPLNRAAAYLKLGKYVGVARTEDFSTFVA
jgi:RNA polymerase II-associated protein 3